MAYLGLLRGRGSAPAFVVCFDRAFPSPVGVVCPLDFLHVKKTMQKAFFMLRICSDV